MTDPHPYRREQEVAVAAVRTAARLCRAVQRGLTPGVLEKADRSPVSVADFGSQAVVCRILQEAFPGDPVVGEERAAALRTPENAALLARVVEHVRAIYSEAGPEAVCDWIDRGAAGAARDRFWTIDPVDGTKGFLRGQQYAVALALIVAGEVQVAALACPNLPSGGPDDDGAGVLFTAVRGGGTYRLALGREGPAERIHTSAVTRPAEAQRCESVEPEHSALGEAAVLAERLGMQRPPLRLDSQAKYGMVARGEADVYLRLPNRPGYVEKIWDHAAGTLVVMEAGGTVTDVAGRPLSFAEGHELSRNRGVVATNGPLHAAVVEALAALEAG